MRVGLKYKTSGMLIWECEWMSNKICKSFMNVDSHCMLTYVSSSLTYCILPSPGNNTNLNFLSVVFFRNVHFQIIPMR